MRCDRCNCSLFSCQCPQGPGNELLDPEENEGLIALGENIGWLRSVRADYANLVESLGDDINEYVLSWDEEAHYEALQRTNKTLSLLQKMFPVRSHGERKQP